jgi:hypothetical protein
VKAQKGSDQVIDSVSRKHYQMPVPAALGGRQSGEEGVDGDDGARELAFDVEKILIAGAPDN